MARQIRHYHVTVFIKWMWNRYCQLTPQCESHSLGMILVFFYPSSRLTVRLTKDRFNVIFPSTLDSSTSSLHQNSVLISCLLQQRYICIDFCCLLDVTTLKHQTTRINHTVPRYVISTLQNQPIVNYYISLT
jgi:hypothetical protein